MTELFAPKVDYNLTSKPNDYALTASMVDYRLTTMFDSKATANAGANVVQPEQSGFVLLETQDLLVDSHPTTAQDAVTSLKSTGVVKLGQSFTGVSGNLLYADFYLKKFGSPTGNAVATLYAHTGTFGGVSSPTGTALATSSNYDVSGLTTDLATVRFTFPEGQNYSLGNGVYYWIVLEYSGGDGTNYVQIGIDATTPTDTGVAKYTWFNAATTWLDYGSDLIYYVYASGVQNNYLLMSDGTSKIILSATR